MLKLDGDGIILGRLASYVAKQLLMGEKIVVVNAGNVVVSGRPKMVFDVYHEKRVRGDRHKGPFFPRNPDRIFWRTVRGMLPDNKRGRDALKLLHVYNDKPQEYSDAEKVGKTVESLTTRHTTLANVSRMLGGKSG